MPTLVEDASMKSFLKLEEAKFNYDNAKGNFLRNNGWTYTSQTPASTWLWEKSLEDGRVVLVDMRTAIDITVALQVKEVRQRYVAENVASK